MSIASDARLRELEKRLGQLQEKIVELSGRLTFLEIGQSPADRRKTAEKIMTRAREASDI